MEDIRPGRSSWLHGDIDEEHVGVEKVSSQEWAVHIHHEEVGHQGVGTELELLSAPSEASDGGAIGGMQTWTACVWVHRRRRKGAGAK